MSVFTLVRRKKDNYHPLTSVASPQVKITEAAMTLFLFSCDTILKGREGEREIETLMTIVESGITSS